MNQEGQEVPIRHESGGAMQGGMGGGGQVNQQMPPEKPKSRMALGILIGLLIVIGLGAAGFLVWYYFFRSVPEPTPQPVTQVEEPVVVEEELALMYGLLDQVSDEPSVEVYYADEDGGQKQVLKTLQGTGRISISDDGKVVWVKNKNTVRIFDATTGADESIWIVTQDYEIVGFAISDDGAKIAFSAMKMEGGPGAGAYSNVISIVDVETEAVTDVYSATDDMFAWNVVDIVRTAAGRDLILYEEMPVASERSNFVGLSYVDAGSANPAPADVELPDTARSWALSPDKEMMAYTTFDQGQGGVVDSELGTVEWQKSGSAPTVILDNQAANGAGGEEVTTYDSAIFVNEDKVAFSEGTGLVSNFEGLALTPPEFSQLKTAELSGADAAPTALLEQKKIQYQLLGATENYLLFREYQYEVTDPTADTPLAVVQLLDFDTGVAEMVFRVVSSGREFLFGDFIEAIAEPKKGT